MTMGPELCLDELMREYQGNVPGACVLVLHNGEPIVRQAYGMADLEREIAATSTTNYRLASVTKQFTAAAVLMLREEGALSFDAPLHEWFPSIDPPAAGATLLHLLTHTSGLIDYEVLIPSGRTGQLHDADVLRLVESEPRTYFAPGSSYRYSNGGYALLALVVERVSGMRFAAFLQERIFSPLGMSGTIAYQRGVSTVINRAYGYSRADGGWKRTDQNPTSAVLGDGGVYSSIEDLAKWDAALYDGRLLRPESLRLAFTPATATDDPATRYGLGWRITGETVWHSGESIGFRNVIVRWPKRRLTVIVLTNRDGLEPYRMALAIAASINPRC
jgi:CubicO group peptidase (beta-lactamase class C family)